MNPQSSGRNPNQANTYREMYMASLLLDISNMNKTLNASRGIVSTGASGAPPVDGRTLTEKYADTDGLKVMIRKQLKEITDGQNAQDIVYELTTNELEFLAGHMPFIISDLKPKFQLGVPAEVFIVYLRKLMRKTIETQGVEYGLQEEAPGGGGLPPPGPNNLMPLEAFQQLLYDLDDILAVPEEGDLQSVGSFASSLAPSEASSNYSQMPIDFGAQFGIPPPPLPPIRPAILRMRDMIHRDMNRNIAAWPTQEDTQIIANCPDPFIVARYQETIADWADTLPNLDDMTQIRDRLEDVIGDGNQDEAARIIKEWSAIVSNINSEVLEDAKDIVRQAKEARLNLEAEAADGDESLFPEDEVDPFFDEEDEQAKLQDYFNEIQASPATVAFYAGNNQPTQVPPEMLGEDQAGSEEATAGDTTENLDTTVAELDTTGDYIPIISYIEFTRLTLNNKRAYLTIWSEMLPDRAIEMFYNEVDDGVGTRYEPDILTSFSNVFPVDEGAVGGDSRELNSIYAVMLQSEIFGQPVGSPLLTDPEQIANLPEELVNEIIVLQVQEPMDPLITREEFEQRSANKGLKIDLGKIEASTETELPGPYTPGGLLYSGDTTPYLPATASASDFLPGGRYNQRPQGNGIETSLKSKKMCGGGDCGCQRCSKKMKFGKLPAGKGKNIIIGRGIMDPPVIKNELLEGKKGGFTGTCGSNRVVPSNIDLSLGVKSEPAYVSFGKHLINKHRLLATDVLMLRTSKGGAIANVPTQRVSQKLSKVLKTIIGGGAPDFESLNSLDDSDKEVLYNVSKTSRISHSVPNPNKSKQEQEDSRFELLKGQIASGQDNKAAIKEFKLLLIKLMAAKRIPRSQAMDILTEMAALGL